MVATTATPPAFKAVKADMFLCPRSGQSDRGRVVGPSNLVAVANSTADCRGTPRKPLLIPRSTPASGCTVTVKFFEGPAYVTASNV